MSPAEKKQFVNGVRGTLVAALLLLITFSVSAAWVDNTGSPTSSNANAPIHVGDTPQAKGTPGLATGTLTLNAGLITNGLRSYLPAIFDQTVQIKGGGPAAGEVLTATDATGAATWQPKGAGNLTYYYQSGPTGAAWQVTGVNSDGTAPTQLTYNNGVEVPIPDNTDGSKHSFCALTAYQNNVGNPGSSGSVASRCRVYTTGGGNFKMMLYQSGNGAGTFCEAVCF